MNKYYNAVKEFHEKFDIPVSEEFTLIPRERYLLRYELMNEENSEYLEACVEESLVDVADALTDKLYILMGTMVEHGMGNIIEKVFDEVQRSNMSKLGEDGKPIRREDGKILKGPNYFKPDIEQYLK